MGTAVKNEQAASLPQAATTPPSDFSALVFPRKAIRAPEAVFALSPAMTLRRELTESLTLQITVSPEAFTAIVASVQGRLKKGEDPSNIELATAVRTFDQSVCKATDAVWRRFAIARDAGSGRAAVELPLAEANVVKALLIYLSGAPHLAASSVSLIISDGKRSPLVGTPQEAPGVATVREMLQTALLSEPRAEVVARWRTAVDEARACLAKHQQIFSLHAQGRSIAQICSMVEVDPRLVGSWLDGAVPQEILRLHRFTSNDHLEFHRIQVSSDLAKPIAHLLGAFQGSNMGSTDHAALSLSFPHAETARAVEELLQSWKISDSVQLAENTSRRGTEYVVSVYSRALFRGLLHATKSNQEVPWQHLPSDEVMLAYLRSYLYFNGSIQEGKFTVGGSRHPAVIVGISFMLDHFGIPCELSSSTHNYVRVKSGFGVARMRELELISSRNLATLDANPPKGDPHIDPRSNYRAYEKFRADNPRAGPKAASVALKVPYQTVVDWFNGRKPFAIAAELELRECRAMYRIPYFGVAHYLSAGFAIPDDEAQKIALAFPLSQVQRAITAFEKVGADISKLGFPHFKRILNPRPRPEIVYEKRRDIWAD
jgi:hypothetical protein